MVAPSMNRRGRGTTARTYGLVCGNSVVASKAHDGGRELLVRIGPPPLVQQADTAIAQGTNRVGVGGGWYDRVLAHRADDVPVWAVVNDDEILDEVPHDPWDESVTAALTPSGLHMLGQ